MASDGRHPDVKEQPPFLSGYALVGVVDKVGVWGGNSIDAAVNLSRYADHRSLFAVHQSAGSASAVRGLRRARLS